MIVTIDTINKTIVLSEETDFLDISKLINNLKSLYGEEDWKISKTVIVKEVQSNHIVKDFMKDILSNKNSYNNPNPYKVTYYNKSHTI